MEKAYIFVLVLCLTLGTISQATITTYFPETDIGGGIYASAIAQVSSGPGYIDVLLTNTSPLGPDISPHGTANPFIMEIEFAIVEGFTLNESASYVSSLSDTLFAQGKGKEAINHGVRNLYYNLVAPDSMDMDMCFMTADADNIRNDNTIGSINVLDASNIPQEGHAAGFLNARPDTYSGAVFDAVLFHLVFNETATPDLNFYAGENALVVKFVGGGDYSMHVSSVPEPATVALLGLGALALLKKRKR